MGITVIIADDHAIVREGIKTILERGAPDIRCVGEASNGKEVLELAAARPAGVYVLDIAMPYLNGIETTIRLIKKDPESRVILMSMHNDASMIDLALRSGARGYVLKEDASEEVLTAIKSVAKGQHFLSPGVSGFVVRGFLDAAKQPAECRQNLSSREKEILQLIAEGNTTREIAAHLGISIHTVHTHRKSIMHKLDMHRQSELIRYALREIVSVDTMAGPSS